MALQETSLISATLEFLKFCNNHSANFFQPPYNSDISVMFEALFSHFESYYWKFMLPDPMELQPDKCQSKFNTFKRYSFMGAAGGTILSSAISYKERIINIFGIHAFNFSNNENHLGCIAMIPALEALLQNNTDSLEKALELSVNLSKSSTIQDGQKTALKIMDYSETLQDVVQNIYTTYRVCSWIERWNLAEFWSDCSKMFQTTSMKKQAAFSRLKQLPPLYENLEKSLNTYRDDVSLFLQKFIAENVTKVDLSLALTKPSFNVLMNDIYSDNEAFSAKITSCITRLQTAKMLGINFYKKLFDVPVPIINSSHLHMFDLIKAAEHLVMEYNDSETASILNKLDLEMRSAFQNLTTTALDRLITHLDQIRTALSRTVDQLIFNTV